MKINTRKFGILTRLETEEREENCREVALKSREVGSGSEESGCDHCHLSGES